MIKVEGDWIDLDQYFDRSLLERSEETFMYAKSEADAAKIYDELERQERQIPVYRSGHMPEHLHFDGNPREGDPIVVPTGPYLLRVSAPPRRWRGRECGDGGRGTGSGRRWGCMGTIRRHMPEMKAIFYAAGPDIRGG